MTCIGRINNYSKEDIRNMNGIHDTKSNKIIHDILKMNCSIIERLRLFNVDINSFIEILDRPGIEKVISLERIKYELEKLIKLCWEQNRNINDLIEKEFVRNELDEERAQLNFIKDCLQGTLDDLKSKGSWLASFDNLKEGIDNLLKENR